MITIKTADLEILESKTFLVPGLGETTVTLNEPDESLSFVLDIRNDEKAEQSVKAELVDEQTLRFVLTNWGGPFATTPIEPIHVGSISNRELYILFSVVKVGDKAEIRQITFTALQGGAVNG